MKKTCRQMRRAGAFTLVELMIVVTIVAILALIAIPLYSSNTVSSMMSEGIAGAGSIRTALRTYYAANGDSYSGATLNTLMINLVDLDGKYFASTDYSLINVTASTYTIKAGPPSQTSKPGMPYYTIDQNGSELGTYYTNQ
ncbi:MAG: prepilin-type N-terminal cleavage/methylation domain-containing protein [Candidatus Brocadiia bacterium]